MREILAAANTVLPLRKCTFLGDKGYDVKDVCNLAKDVYEGETVIPLNKRNTRDPKKLPAGNPICDAGLAMHKDGKTSDIVREYLQFKRTYALRTECERYNSRFKTFGQERLWIRNGNSAANLNTLAHITALAVACAAVLSRSHHSYRSAKSLQRTA